MRIEHKDTLRKSINVFRQNMYKQTTMVPNNIFDEYLPYLSKAEVKVLLVVIRQTNGWIDQRTGKRKRVDRISQKQFVQKTGLSRKGVTNAITKLSLRRLIAVNDTRGNVLVLPQYRRRKKYLYYSLGTALTERKIQPMQRKLHRVSDVVIHDMKVRK